MDFEIKLPLFEGPFDLLLFFIERDELDIYDIPIAKITDDFLGYLQQMEEMNIELASEFIVVAATLMRIKSKMLLPRQETEEDEEDPRDELIRYLLEYKKYKSILPVFQNMEEEQMKKEKRGNIEQENHQISDLNEVEYELHRLDLYKILKVYERVMQRHEDRQAKGKHTIIPYPYTISGQRDYLTKKITQRKGRVSFKEIISDYVVNTKIALIYNFLAILELIQNRVVTLQIGEGYNDFWIETIEEENKNSSQSNPLPDVEV